MIHMDECDQRAIDESWSLARTNACHIGVMNSEMGEIVKTQEQMAWKIDLMFGFMALCATTIVVMGIKKILKSNGKSK